MNKTLTLALAVFLLLLLAGCSSLEPVQSVSAQSNCETIYTFESGAYLLLCQLEPAVTDTPVVATSTPVAPTATATRSRVTATPTMALPPTETQPPSGEPIVPFPEAPLCPDSGDVHNLGQYHALWDAERGCHYDHEHGQDPFVPEVEAAFPGFDLNALLGGVEVGHANPSSGIENTDKHGGFKWDVTLEHSDGCMPSIFGEIGVDALVVQYHAFADYVQEMEARIHSAVGLFRQCHPSNPEDKGYVYVAQHLDYGQRVSPYQGEILPYPDTPFPAYNSGLSPYFSIDCYGGETAPCNRYPSLTFIRNTKQDTNSTWISAPRSNVTFSSPLFGIAFRLRDTLQVLFGPDRTYPFTFAYVCSSDGGQTFDPNVPNCRWNNSTTRVHQIEGRIPNAWASSGQFEVEQSCHNVNGQNRCYARLTGQAFVTAFGHLVSEGACHMPGTNCHPVVLDRAFVASYASGFQLTEGRENVFDPRNLPERDVYFCDQTACDEFSPGARPSGWIGPKN